MTKCLIIQVFFTIALLSSSLFADSTAFRGYYLGGSVGLGINQANLSSGFLIDVVDNFVEPLRAGNLTFLDVKAVGKTGWGEIFAGWGTVCFKRYYWGSRVGLSLSQFEVSADQSGEFFVLTANAGYPGTFESRITGQCQMLDVTLDVKFGWLISCDTLFYTFAGAALNRPKILLKSKAERSRFVTSPTADLAVDFDLKQRGGTLHPRWGFGIETLLTRCLGAYVQYSSTYYKSVSAIARLESESITPGAAFDAVTAGRVNLSRQVFSTGLSYHF